MTETFNIDDLSRYKENNRLEAKLAKKAVPDSVWETYSSFANTEGGVILLGVEELDDHSLRVVGVEDAHKIITDFWNVANNPQKVSVNILLNRMVHEEEVDGKAIVVIDVPRAERSVRPVYIGNNPINGAFRRNGEGDYHCTKDQISAMLRDASDVTQDKRVLTERTNEVFCQQTIKDYRDRFRDFHQTHIWNKDEDEMFLRHIGAIALSHDDQKYHPTAAGLLMFGYEYEITNEFPQYFLDYREEMDEKVRWTHRVTSSSGDWSGNLYDFFWRVYPRLKSDLPVPFELKDGVGRVDENETNMAIREFLLNCLAHADHYGRQGIVIRRGVKTMYLANPGDIRIGLEAALQGGTSDPRNAAIMTMFGLVGIGDRAGTGMPDAIATAKEKLAAKVEYSVSLEPERTTLSLVMDIEARDKTSDKIEKRAINDGKTSDKADKRAINEGKTSDKTEKQGINIRIVEKTSDKIERIEGISQKTRDNLLILLEYMDTHPVVHNSDIAALLSISPNRARVHLMLLVDNGFLVAKGDKKERTYHLIQQ